MFLIKNFYNKKKCLYTYIRFVRKNNNYQKQRNNLLKNLIQKFVSAHEF